MGLFDEKVTKQLTGILAMMKREVKLLYFTQEIECQTCRDGRRFIDEIAAMNSKMSVVHKNLLVDQADAALYQVDKVPAIVLLDAKDNDTRIKFYGIPAGYEINSFLGAILEVSGHLEPLPSDLSARIAKINKDIHLQVFVTLGCPYCPSAVVAAHRLALENKHIRADMVESNTFVFLTVRYGVSGVPKTIINEKHELTGSQPIQALVDLIETI